MILVHNTVQNKRKRSISYCVLIKISWQVKIVFILLVVENQVCMILVSVTHSVLLRLSIQSKIKTIREIKEIVEQIRSNLSHREGIVDHEDLIRNYEILLDGLTPPSIQDKLQVHRHHHQNTSGKRLCHLLIRISALLSVFDYKTNWQVTQLTVA